MIDLGTICLHRYIDGFQAIGCFERFPENPEHLLTDAASASPPTLRRNFVPPIGFAPLQISLEAGQSPRVLVNTWAVRLVGAAARQWGPAPLWGDDGPLFPAYAIGSVGQR